MTLATKQTAAVFLLLTFVTHLSSGLYIKPAAHKPKASQYEWRIFQQQLGLTDQKVELLKSQKDQQGTLEALQRFIKENPKYVVVNADNKDKSKESNSFLRLYDALVTQLKQSKRPLKTSLNFEVADKPVKNLRRSRRKIAVKMISDIPSDEIDDLLKIFNQRHSIDLDAVDDVDNDAADADYADISSAAALPSAADNDWMYENLYEDEKDLAVPAKTHHNSEFGSFQDLILQAKRNQWQREVEESKLRPHHNSHFL